MAINEATVVSGAVASPPPFEQTMKVMEEHHILASGVMDLEVVRFRRTDSAGESHTWDISKELADQLTDQQIADMLLMWVHNTIIERTKTKDLGRWGIRNDVAVG